MRTLVIPPAAQRDNDSVQMLSAWIAENGLHCTMNVGIWHAQGRREARAWGILLADVIRHLANAIEEQQGLPLCWAAFFGRPEVVRVLLAAGSEVNQRNKHDLTPLACAFGGADGRWQQFSDASLTQWQECFDAIALDGGCE